jgi:hypothetical protein
MADIEIEYDGRKFISKDDPSADCGIDLGMMCAFDTEAAGCGANKCTPSGYVNGSKLGRNIIWLELAP